MLPPFKNEPLTDFSQPDRAAAYRQALARVRRGFGGHQPLIIGGREVDAGDCMASLNPCKPGEVIGTVAAAGPPEVDRALDAAWEAFPKWAHLPAAERAHAAVRLAGELRRRRLELAALMTLEAAKNWAEADADVAEAIDYCEYYARQALELARPVPTHAWPGEINQSWLKPLGAGAIISPWNFPLAILAGMTMGPVAAGNTVVVKPSSQTPLIGAAFMEAVAAAGLPDGVINFIPGIGSAMGDYLVEHPRCRFINFTGSRDVGLAIMARAAAVQPGQAWLKRVSLELGGKGAIVVDETADLAAAAQAVVHSAYSYQGQKCSACSRVIVVDTVYDAFVKHLVAAARDLTVGPAEANFPVAAVISSEQQQKILAEIDRGKSEARLVAGGRALNLDGGYFIEPTIFAEVPPDSRLGQVEIFGPVLSVLRARDFDDGGGSVQRHRVRPHRRAVFPAPGAPRPGPVRV